VPTIDPIDDAQRRCVATATEDCIARAGIILGRRFATIPVGFDLTGRAAGMYRVTRRERIIRYNPYIFAKAFADNLATTVPHEVAHYVVDVVHGWRNVRPHGREWRAIMTAFGADPDRTHAYDLAGVPVRRQRRHPYRCGCTTHHLTTRRHNQVRRGAMRYHCRHCGEELVQAGQVSW
jgi:SprT protein